MSDDFCLVHGYEHMKRHSIFDKIPYCELCEDERKGTEKELAEPPFSPAENMNAPRTVSNSAKEYGS